MQKINRIGKDKLYLSGGQKINLSYLKQEFAKESALDFALLDQIIQKFCNLIKQEPNLLKINDPVTVIGDIHGQYWDLIKLLSLCPSIENPKQKFLFLGDYVDRGIYGSEVTILLFCMKINYPNQIFMLRGNHESRTMTLANNFLTQFTSKYNQALYEKIMFSFDLLPALAIINDRFFCVHGGLSLELLNMSKLDDVNKLNRAIQIPREGIFCDLYWSDPIPDEKGQMQQLTYSNYTRGCSIFFGAEMTKKFLKMHKMGMIIRAHEILNLQGFKQHLWQQNGGPVVLTIFSAPNYCGSYGNKAVILTIDNNKMKMRQFHQDKLKMQLNPQINAVNLTYQKIHKTLDNFMKYFAHTVVKIKFKQFKKVQNLSKEDKIKLLLLAYKQQPRKKWNINTKPSSQQNFQIPKMKHKQSITDLQNVDKQEKQIDDLQNKIAIFRRSDSYFKQRDALPQTTKLFKTQAKLR